MYSIISIVDTIFQIYFWLIFAYILMSWVPQMRETPVGELLGKLVEPYLRPFRKIIPPIGMIDISPIVAFFALDFIREGLKTVLRFLFL
ncbi:YggT family protein [Tepidibacillus infernus]|uniref:Cell division protein n=1 Tax=Tepidibacillus decaturensis TaxID=1413211 RepID=A0A135L495_9BACI|nr:MULTISPECIES: YggT family protein [Tepidibacillus]KXG43757.1 cell division protein [Tepidibacillus decaturensis]GBF11962.1 YGGT family protein [Tepidibacillus sp. HK-1]